MITFSRGAKRWIISLGLIFIVIFGVVFWWTLQHRPAATDDVTDDQASSLDASNSVETKDQADQDTLDLKVSDGASDEESYALLITKINVAEESGDWQAILDYAHEILNLDSYKDDYSTLLWLAEADRHLNNKSELKSTLEKLKVIYETNDATDSDSYRQLIEELQNL